MNLSEQAFADRLKVRRAEREARIEPMPKGWYCEAGHNLLWQRPQGYALPDGSVILLCKRHDADPTVCILGFEV